SADHVVSFLRVLGAELAVYVGCLNLHEELSARQADLCFPVPEAGRPAMTADGLRDASLVLRLGGRVVGNDVHAADRSLVVITGGPGGANLTGESGWEVDPAPRYRVG